jgi:hypothetical protein
VDDPPSLLNWGLRDDFFAMEDLDRVVLLIREPHVVAPIAKRPDLERKDVQLKIQVGTKAARRDFGRQVAIRRGKDAHVYWSCCQSHLISK